MIADRYELDREIGQGGATSVWVAHDTVLGRTVALKRLGHAPGSSEIDAARAEREAHLAARVHHPNIVAVYDIADDVDADTTWLVMEYVDGPTLAELCDAMPLEADRAARLLGQVADALAAAHDADMIHRDVKPSNVFVAAGDVAKLGDFGIARREMDEALTRTGLITGSPAFLAPEIARGRTATTASDVWAFGVTVFHAATGSPPFDVAEDDPITAIQTILDSATPILPADHPLAPVVAATLQQDPDERASMREVAELLDAIVHPDGTHRSVLADLLIDHVPRDDFSEVPAPAAPRPRVLPDRGADTEPTSAVQGNDGSNDAEHTRPAAARRDPHRTRVTPLPPTSAAPSRSHAADSPPAWRDRRIGLVAAAAVAVLASTLTGVVLTSGDDDGTTVASSATGGGASGDAAPSLAEQLENFADTYVTTAAGNPSEGFALLTADYQQASGGLEGYASFWENVEDVRIERITPDPDAMRVTYVYSYRYEGVRRVETVTLDLTKDGSRYLIDGAESV